jgi:hypothetical protein
VEYRGLVWMCQKNYHEWEELNVPDLNILKCRRTFINRGPVCAESGAKGARCVVSPISL